MGETTAQPNLEMQPLSEVAKAFWQELQAGNITPETKPNDKEFGGGRYWWGKEEK